MRKSWWNFSIVYLPVLGTAFINDQKRLTSFLLPILPSPKDGRCNHHTSTHEGVHRTEKALGWWYAALLHSGVSHYQFVEQNLHFLPSKEQACTTLRENKNQCLRSSLALIMTEAQRGLGEIKQLIWVYEEKLRMTIRLSASKSVATMR